MERANDGNGLGSAGGHGAMSINVDNLEETTFEVTLGLTEEQEAELEAAAHPARVQPEWLKKSQFVADDEPDVKETEETEADAVTKNEEAIKEEWLKAYLSALQGAQAEAPPDDEEPGAGGNELKKGASTDALVDAAVEMADDVADDEEWDDVEEDWDDA